MKIAAIGSRLDAWEALAGRRCRGAGKAAAVRTRRGAPTGRGTRRSEPLQRRDAALCVGMRRPRWQSIRRQLGLERRDGYRDPDVAGAGQRARPERELRARSRARVEGRPAPGPDAGGDRAPGANSP
ncbi:hypothetical protein DF117_27485 [Burkholderia stagnalis]|nr:hypothetical protein DF117_27485 [Burkholderia stagnalis]